MKLKTIRPATKEEKIIARVLLQLKIASKDNHGNILVDKEKIRKHENVGEAAANHIVIDNIKEASIRKNMENLLGDN